MVIWISIQVKLANLVREVDLAAIGLKKKMIIPIVIVKAKMRVEVL